MMELIMCFVLLSILYLFSDYYSMNKWLMVWSIFWLSFKILLMGLSTWGWMNIGMIYLSFGLDYISLNLLILSFWIIGLMLMAYMSMDKVNYFIFLMFILLLDMIFFFSSMNLFFLYIFFEISIIPMFLLILGWGYSSDRFEAGFYMLVYTLVFSLPVMYVIFEIYNDCGSMLMDILFNKLYNCEMNLLFYFLFVLIFMVKMPMYMIHGWLPKAHVEAPLIGSMFLAGVLLKMGGFGLMRFLKLSLNHTMIYNGVFIALSLIGMIILSFQCLIQYDLKVLVAYSSVVHMGAVICGIMVMTTWGWLGSVMMMIAHGLCSSGMFFIVNMNYETFMSRSLLINKGTMHLMPSMSLFWFLICSCNMSIPLSLNLVGEVFLLSSLIFWCYWILVVLIFILFFSACYSLYLFSFTQHGGFSLSLTSLVSKDLVVNYLICILHWVPLNLLMFNLLFILI